MSDGMEFTQTTIYQKAFERYLRRGTPIEVSVKALLMAAKAEAEKHPTSYYIWRTQGDSKVRPSHAANNGKIFAWDNPPPTGNPGEEYGCRCTAEPYYGIYDPPIEPVYPELILPAFRIGRGAFALAERILFRGAGVRSSERANLTEHGELRSLQRNVTVEEEQETIRSGKETGNVSTKIGKYGTPQIHYRGSNGITVVVETSGRNAGKVITFMRH